MAAHRPVRKLDVCIHAGRLPLCHGGQLKSIHFSHFPVWPPMWGHALRIHPVGAAEPGFVPRLRSDSPNRRVKIERLWIGTLKFRFSFRISNFYGYYLSIGRKK